MVITGSNYGTHVCDCHYEADGCIEEETKHNTCNCDAILPIPSTDTGELEHWLGLYISNSGTITNMTALPVMKLFFGGLNYELQSAAFQLGRLKCYGDKPAGNTHTKLVFCDMKSGTYTDVPQVKNIDNEIDIFDTLFQVDEISSASPLSKKAMLWQ